ncbi:hypothetical protein CSB93_6178 [Pseudomonas paraeruginosa]|uniref:Uncharacterized protein n=1 Tax=Pseudomonas paraeruginosa TaxID=2994495 RepID=A0A2R3IRY9_9PSED|nr:hypothetical protein CSB93_6178 [Pseudomonas paraeruginosa]AWE91035.1 hypothetical protein CSC28_4978 [Pseudomonas paraeruginosa]PTC34948.1 hypothetical protein CLJ1_4558 [Pseudomonas aeruginosa]
MRTIEQRTLHTVPRSSIGTYCSLQQVRSSNSSMKGNKLATAHEQPVKNSAPPL